MVPSIRLNPKASDRKIVYKTGKSRLDKLSQQFYDSPYYGWLIMLANPNIRGSGVEYSRPDTNNSTISTNGVTRGI